MTSLNVFASKSTDTATDSVFSPVTPSPLFKPAVSPNPSERHPADHPALNFASNTYVPNSSSPMSGVIGPRMVIKGDIEFEGELMIQGTVTGNIRSSSDDSKSVLRIDAKASVTGDVNVPIVKVSGTLTGNVSASELLHLHPTGIIVGPVKYNNIQLESGCTVEGSLTPEFKNARK